MYAVFTGRRPTVRIAMLPALCLALAVLYPPAVFARPSSMKLFPEETLAFIRVADARELIERVKDTAVGRMLRDPQLQPFLEHLYGKAGDFYAEKAEGKLGVSWEQLQQLPQGEIAFAIVARQGQMPSFLLLVDLGEDPGVAQRLVEGFLEQARQEGSEISTETVDGVEVTVLAELGGGDELRFFWKENALVAAMAPELLREVLHHWDGDVPATESSAEPSSDATAEGQGPSQFSGRTLAENSRFSTILRHCRRPQDPPPQLIYFVDPIGLFREFGRGNPGMQIAIATFPALGLDGLLGIGGTTTYAAGPYDDLSHMHLLLENPRAGVIQLLAFETGDMTPQPWVPWATENYMTGHWNFRATYDRLAAIIDRLQHPGATDEFVANKFSENLGVDVLTDVIGNLAGRVTYITAYEKPATIRSSKQVMALELIDEAAAVKTLDTVRARYPDLFEEHTFGKVTYYALVPEWLKAMPEEQRPFTPMLAIMDGSLFVGGSAQLFERFVAARDGTVERLADSEDYVRLFSTLGTETAGATPAMLVVSRVEETLRHWYELVTSERSREYFEEQSEKNPFFAALAEALAAHELPPFDVLVPYMAPGGAIFYDTDSGFHSIGFTLRNEAEP